MNFQPNNLKGSYPVGPVARPPPEYVNGASPKAGYKGPGVHRPQPITDRMKNPLLKEVDDELRRLKTQFDNFKNDPYLGKGQANSGQHEPAPTATYAPKGPFVQNSSKPITAPSGFISGPSGIPQQGQEYKVPLTQSQPKKVAQSFEGVKNTLGQSNITDGKAPLNPEQYPRSAVTSVEKHENQQLQKSANPTQHQHWPQYKPTYIEQRQQRPPPKSAIQNPQGQQERMAQQNVSAQAQSQSQVREQPIKNPPPPQQKPVQQQVRTQNQQSTIKAEQKVAQQSRVEPNKPAKQEQHQNPPEAPRQQQMKFEPAKQPPPKQQQPQPNPKQLSNKPLANLRPNPPPHMAQQGQPAPAKPKQEAVLHKEQQHSLNVLAENVALSTHIQSEPVTHRSENELPHKQETVQFTSNRKQPSTYAEPRPLPEAPKSQAAARRPIHKPIIDSSSEYNKFESYNSQRVKYQDPVVNNPAPVQQSDYRDMSPSQKERELSIKRNQAQKMAEQQERILTLTKTVANLSKQNTHLKFQVTKLTEQLKNSERIKAESQQARKTLKELSDKHGQHVILYEESLKTIENKDKQIKDMQVEMERLKNTFQCEKNEEGFHMALKTQMEENQRIKSRFQDKDEEIENLRQLNKTLRSQVDSYKNEIEIERLKKMAEIKNMQSNYDIENQKQINEIDSLQKLVNSLDEKFKFMIKEDRKKDEFLVNYLKGKTHDPNDKELVVNFFKQFEEVPKITMSELMRQQRQINEQLKKENHQLRNFIESRRPHA